MRASLLGRNISRKSCVAARCINERCRRIDNGGETKRAGGAAFLVGIGFGRMTIAFVTGGFRFHFRAAIGFLDFRLDGLPGNSRERERTGNDETKQESKSPSHHI